MFGKHICTLSASKGSTLLTVQRNNAFEPHDVRTYKTKKLAEEIEKNTFS